MKYHHGNLKEELILSACIICEADGHDHMSLRSLQKRLRYPKRLPTGISKPKNLYWLKYLHADIQN